MTTPPPTVDGAPSVIMVHATRFAKFGLVGLLNTAIDLAVFTMLFYGAELPLLVANTCALIVAASNSYLMNKYWTFQDRRKGREAYRAGVLFFALGLVGLGIANLVIWALSNVIPVIIAKGASMVFTMVWNYWSSHRFVYRHGDT